MDVFREDKINNPLMHCLSAGVSWNDLKWLYPDES